MKKKHTDNNNLSYISRLKRLKIKLTNVLHELSTAYKHFYTIIDIVKELKAEGLPLDEDEVCDCDLDGVGEFDYEVLNTFLMETEDAISDLKHQEKMKD